MAKQTSKKRKTGREISGDGRTRSLSLEMRNRLQSAKLAVMRAETPVQKRMAITRLDNIQRMIKRMSKK